MLWVWEALAKANPLLVFLTASVRGCSSLAL